MPRPSKNQGTKPIIDFDGTFEALTGHNPLRWQRRLYQQMQCPETEMPTLLDLPTGLGKTSVIQIWLIALAQQKLDGRITLPRRLAYIVNRRTVVDQATSTAEQIIRRLQPQANGQHQDHLAPLLQALQLLSPGEPAVAVSTLRGELADNEEWKKDPSKPAIIIGTIDMIGSKLLFNGYGDGPYKRAHHTGIIGQDTLFVHDEAHLSPAFSKLLHSVAAVQRQDGDTHPIQVMELSATQRQNADSTRVFSLKDPEDSKDKVVEDRVTAKKSLRLHPAKDSKEKKSLIADLAMAYGESCDKILIYVGSPKDASETASQLKKRLGTGSDRRVALLTGTVRGHERDLLVSQNPVYRHLMDPEAKPPETVYLISTSAGEVGIDLDADHMVCDLATLDSIIQRFGRVNRRGGNSREAQIDMVWTEKEANPDEKAKGIERARSQALAVIRRWSGSQDNAVDASPQSLRQLMNKLKDEETANASAPVPQTLPVTGIILDAWALTSMEDMPNRPDVAQYLHGRTEDPPETYVAWREEVSLFAKYDLSPRAMSDWFRACRIHAKEKVQEPTSQVRKYLKTLLIEHDKANAKHNIEVLLMDRNGKVQRYPLKEIADDRNIDLRYKTIILPAEAGGLTADGTLNAKNIHTDTNPDIADTSNFQRERWIYGPGEHKKRLSPNGDSSSGNEPPEGWKERESITLETPDDTEGTKELVLLAPSRDVADDDPATAKFHQTLEYHTTAIAQHMDKIAERLDLDHQIKDALVTAATWHDKGKDREIWQNYACKPDGEKPLAKSTRYLNPHALAGYRHEFGSLLDAMRDPAIQEDPERDLILHLVAAHHGHARPHFPTRAYDKSQFTTAQNEQAAIETAQRFGRLQKKFGRYGLAWLESLMRCADIAASQPPEDPTTAPRRPTITSFEANGWFPMGQGKPIQLAMQI